VSHAISLVRHEADELQREDDALFGYPRHGVDVGGGIHAPRDASVTTHKQAVYEHPNKNKYRYEVDAPLKDKANAGKLSQNSKKLVDDAVEELPTDWIE